MIPAWRATNWRTATAGSIRSSNPRRASLVRSLQPDWAMGAASKRRAAGRAILSSSRRFRASHRSRGAQFVVADASPANRSFTQMTTIDALRPSALRKDPRAAREGSGWEIALGSFLTVRCTKGLCPPSGRDPFYAVNLECRRNAGVICGSSLWSLPACCAR